jgi:hypothetical protein
VNLRSIVLGAALAALPCAAVAQGPARAVTATIEDVSWIAGTWRTDPASTVFEELWTSGAGGAMFAIARTFTGEKLVAFEFLRIVERAGGLVYIAQPNGRPPTEFVLTGYSAQSVTFENPRHDFPKMVRYTLRSDGKLEATVSDGGTKAERFLFARAR